MAQRAVDHKTAQEVCTAVELARTGACASLIENASGFGPRWVRRIVKSNGGVLARKLRDPARWLDSRRLLHAYFIVRAYECRPANLTRASTLLSTYQAYRDNCVPPSLLDVNECAQIVDLYREGVLWLKWCNTCKHHQLVHADCTPCPVCRDMARTFCGVCGVQLPADSVRPRMYCAEHSVRATRVAVRRKAKQLLILGRQSQRRDLASAT